MCRLNEEIWEPLWYLLISRQLLDWFFFFSMWGWMMKRKIEGMEPSKYFELISRFLVKILRRLIFNEKLTIQFSTEYWLVDFHKNVDLSIFNENSFVEF